MYVKTIGIRSFVTVFSIILLILCSACDDFKSQEFQMSGVDAVACDQLSDTLFSTLTLKSLTSFNPEWVDENVEANISAVLDSLEANNIVLNADGSEAVEIVTTSADTNWFALKSDFGSIATYLTETVEMNLLNSAGSLQKTSDATMPFEIAGGCTVLEKDKPVPLIRARFKYSVSDDRYLVQFIKGEQTRTGRIKISALNNQ